MTTAPLLPGPRGPNRDPGKPRRLALHACLVLLFLVAVSMFATPGADSPKRVANNAVPIPGPQDSEEKPKNVPISDFLPGRVRLLDVRQEGKEPMKFLFRGNAPVLADSSVAETGYRFAWDELVKALRTTAESAGRKLPEDVYVNVVSLLDPATESLGLKTEQDFFETRGEQGTVVSWPLVGDASAPLSLPAAERRTKAASVESWQSDLLIPRTYQLRQWLLSAVPKFYLIDAENLEDQPLGSPHAGFVVYIHCNHGQDRTGELAAAYRIWYLNGTVEKELEYNRGMGADVVENENAVKWFGEWWAVNGTRAGRG